jgi:hypothetical protein
MKGKYEKNNKQTKNMQKGEEEEKEIRYKVFI